MGENQLTGKKKKGHPKQITLYGVDIIALVNDDHKKLYGQSDIKSQTGNRTLIAKPPVKSFDHSLTASLPAPMHHAPFADTACT